MCRLIIEIIYTWTPGYTKTDVVGETNKSNEHSSWLLSMMPVFSHTNTISQY